MPFPTSIRYTFWLGPTATGLSPLLRFQDAQQNPAFQRMDTLAQVAPPAISELGGGRYYFDWTWQAATDPDYSFILDGGPTLVTDVERYVPGTISPRDVATATSGGGGGGGGFTVIG